MRSGSTLSKPRVLLVDDNQAILDCLVRMLGRDYTIVGAIRDGPRMLDAVAILKPDIVVMDISMPEMSGLELAAELRQLPTTAHLFLFSASVDRRDREIAERLQLHVISKVDRVSLFQTMKMLHEESTARRSA